MIDIVALTVRGQCQLGEFSGALAFEPGLQVISANNRYGKSLAVTSIAWCLGLERMFGLQDNDPSRFSGAVRDVIELAGRSDVLVHSSEAELTIRRADASRLRLTRAIKGDASVVRVQEIASNGELGRATSLLARKQTMKDDSGGLQNFLFRWCGLPRMAVVDTRGDASELYLENVAPLFYIDQNEGWTDLQALQVHRYGLLEVADIAVEYLLGAKEAIEARFARQTIAAQDARLKANASVIAGQVAALFQRCGWTIEWSDHGSVSAIAKRWGIRSLAVALKAELNFDLASQQQELQERAAALRAYLATGDLDSTNTAPSSDASQSVVELKEKRHARREELRILRRQRTEQVELLDNLEHRLHSARDILRLKVEGIGRIESIECPTCHRTIDPATFELTAQSSESVSAHIEALGRDRRLVANNRAALDDQVIRVAGHLRAIEDRLREAERSLVAVNQAVGAVREQLTKAATDLVAVESELERLTSLGEEIRGLQENIDRWIDSAKPSVAVPVHEFDLQRRQTVFVSRLLVLLRELGHGGILAQPDAELRLDEHYIPYLGPRRLRSLGSASDHSRLVAAYVLALAAASESINGFHPGFVVLDEPLQQNPDESHRNLFVDFLIGDVARRLQVQTLIFTWLHPPEIARLAAAGVRIMTPKGEHFLELKGEGGSVAAGDMEHFSG